MKVRFIFSLMFLLFAGCLVSQVNRDSLDYILETQLNKEKVTGMAVVVFSVDTIVYANGFGYANKEESIKYTINTVQPIASISKTLIGFSLTKAQALGIVNLDADINNYLPFKIRNPYYPNEKITLRHLATHSSGLRDRMLNEKAYIFNSKLPPLYKKIPWGLKRFVVKKYLKIYNKNVKIPLAEFLQKTYVKSGEWYNKRNFLNAKPGEKYEYSNNGAALAAFVIERASGIDYKTFVKQHILTPLKMDKSGWSLGDYAINEKSVLYVEGERVPEYECITYPDGGFVTNVVDFTKYMQYVMCIYNDQIDTSFALASKEMLHPQINPDFNTGLFWDIAPKAIGHTGGDPGISTLAYFGKTGRKGILIFMNTSNLESSGKELSGVLNILKNYP